LGYNVLFIPAAEKEFEKLLDKHPSMIEPLEELIRTLEFEPQVYPKKRGKLRACRAASFNVASGVWRLIFRIKEKQNEVEILALGPHDAAYQAAERRV
jgi:mRNA-degrading endonuclease RelE of RelBE toxin-antitoxin system